LETPERIDDVQVELRELKNQLSEAGTQIPLKIDQRIVATALVMQ
jgi:hypothetical protein